MNKKGQLAIYLSFIMMAIITIVIAAVVAPFGSKLTTDLFNAGEDILLLTNESLQDIGNNEIKDSIQGVFDSAFAAQENNITVNLQIFQYAWIPIVFLAGLVVFLYTRRLTELTGGGFV